MEKTIQKNMAAATTTCINPEIARRRPETKSSAVFFRSASAFPAIKAASPSMKKFKARLLGPCIV
ncbi:hypothetical protein D3C72_2495480 [compost metagenome]